MFYKRGITTSPKLIKKDLIVEFSGEEGDDVGALKFEFFEKMLQEMNEKFLQKLIFSEVIEKRQQAVNAFCRGPK